MWLLISFRPTNERAIVAELSLVPQQHPPTLSLSRSVSLCYEPLRGYRAENKNHIKTKMFRRQTKQESALSLLFVFTFFAFFALFTFLAHRESWTLGAHTFCRSLPCPYSDLLFPFPPQAVSRTPQLKAAALAASTHRPLAEQVFAVTARGVRRCPRLEHTGVPPPPAS